MRAHSVDVFLLHVDVHGKTMHVVERAPPQMRAAASGSAGALATGDNTRPPRRRQHGHIHGEQGQFVVS